MLCAPRESTKNLILTTVMTNIAVDNIKDCAKCDEMRDTKTFNLSRLIVSFQVLGRYFAFFHLT